MFNIRRATTAVGVAGLIALAAAGCGTTKFAAPSQTLAADPGAHVTAPPKAPTTTTHQAPVSPTGQSDPASDPASTTATTRTPTTAATPTTVAAASTPAAASPSAAALPTITLSSFTGIKPTSISFTMDGTNGVIDLVWSSWSASGARATGTQLVDNCVPDCADAPPRQAPVVITLSGESGGQFTSLTESGSLLTQTFSLPSDVLTTG